MQELSRELVIQQPPDHVIFLKQILENAARCRDVARIVLLSTPKVNTIEVANHISRQTAQVVITEESVMNCFDRVLFASFFEPFLITSIFNSAKLHEKAWHQQS